MRGVSAAWLRTVVGSHRALYRATVCSTFQTGTSPSGERIGIIDGDVIIDATAKIRSTLDLTTPGAGMWPTRSTSTLAPYGTEIYVERGIFYTDALVEFCGLGYFRINRMRQDQAPDGPIRISAKDRMGQIIKARMLEPQQFEVGASLGYVVTTLVQGVYPDAVVEWDDSTDDIVLTRSHVVDGDRHAFLDELVRANGKIWYWDHRGVLVIESPPDPTQPVWTIHAGRGGVLIDVARELSDEDVVNAVVASGEAVDTYDPPTATAKDDDPLSPTYFSGPFGPVPGYLTSPHIQTHAQAVAAAETELRRRMGLPHIMDLTAVPNAALEPYDPVSVRVGREGRRTHVLDSITIPLADGRPMTALTREQSTVLITTT